MIKAATQRLLERAPLAVAAAGSLAGIALAEAEWVPAWGWLLVVPAVVLAVRGRGLPALGLVAVGCFWSLHGDRLDRLEAMEEWLGPSGAREAVLEGVLLRRDGEFQATLRTVAGDGELPGGVRLRMENAPRSVLPGDRLRLRASLRLPAPARNPGERDDRAMLRRGGLAAELWGESVEVTGSPAILCTLQRWSWMLRSEVRRRILLGLEEGSRAAALIEGLVLGEREGMGPSETAAFRRSGTMHVFAVSGLHVGLVGAIGWFLMAFLRVPRGAGLWLVLGLMWSYAFVTGLRPPAMRAVIMATVFLLGFAVRRRPALLNGLLASMPIVLVLDSFQWRQAGFQLSYVVVGAILLLAPVFYRRTRRWVDGDPFLPRVLYSPRQEFWRSAREKISGLVTVSLAAWLGSLPLMALHFGIVTPSAVFASVLLVPMVFAILAVALSGIAAGVIAEPLEAGLNTLNGALAEGAFGVARAVSEMPGAFVRFDRSGESGDGLVIYDLWGGAGAVFCDAGDGVLLDAGSEREFWRVVRPAVRRAGRSPASLVVSHADGSHCGGMADAIRTWRPRQLLVPEQAARSPAYGAMLRAAGEEGCRVLLAGAERSYPVGEGVSLEFLDLPDGGGSRVADDRCAVMRLHWNGWRILLTGDAGLLTERRLLEGGTEVESDVWVMGRHDSDFAGTMEFVQAVAPRVIVATEAWFPESERVPDWWAAMIAEQGITLFRQAETGGVICRPRPGRLEVRPWLQPERGVTLRRGRDASP
jgi:ComEC/Rec2-related protein